MHPFFMDKLIKKADDPLFYDLYKKASDKDKLKALDITYEQKHIHDLEDKCSELSDVYMEDAGSSTRYTTMLEKKIDLAEQAVEKALVKEFKKQLSSIIEHTDSPG